MSSATASVGCMCVVWDVALQHDMAKGGYARSREHLLCDAPGGVPIEVLLIDEQAHELCDSNRGVCVVHLKYCLLGKQLPFIAMLRLEPCQGILRSQCNTERCGIYRNCKKAYPTLIMLTPNSHIHPLLKGDRAAILRRLWKWGRGRVTGQVSTDTCPDEILTCVNHQGT
jgi:hypothetical protein